MDVSEVPPSRCSRVVCVCKREMRWGVSTRYGTCARGAVRPGEQLAGPNIGGVRLVRGHLTGFDIDGDMVDSIALTLRIDIVLEGEFSSVV